MHDFGVQLPNFTFYRERKQTAAIFSFSFLTSPTLDGASRDNRDEVSVFATAAVVVSAVVS